MDDSRTYPQHGVFNPEFELKKSGVKDLEYYLKGLASGNTFVLSEAITLIESLNEKKQYLASLLLDWAFDHAPKDTIRIAVTGSPGVGKSTFIESFGLLAVQNNYKLAVLAIDPSSQLNKGSILGDKTRMGVLSVTPDVFIRPTASGGTLGGTAAQTKDAILLCEAAGYNMIIVETVGVGQSEVEVSNMTDVSVLLLQPGAGDEIQGIKRGIVENADIIVINKADGAQLNLAKESKNAYTQALQLFHHPMSQWDQPVLLASALQNEGLNEILMTIIDFVHLSKKSGYFLSRRQHQESKWFTRQVLNRVENIVFSNELVRSTYQKLLADLKETKISTPSALRRMENILRLEFEHKKE